MATSNYNNTQKDIIATIFKALNERQNILLQDIFGDITEKDLEKIEEQLNLYRKELQLAFNNMRSTMVEQGKYLTQLRTKKELEQGDIVSRISDLISAISTKQHNLEENEFGIDIREFFNTFFPNLNTNLYQNDDQISAISQFIFKYQSLKDKILETQEILGKTTEKIRGDKLYYGILLERADPSQKGKDASKLLKLSREQFEKFERENTDLFEIALSRRKTKQGQEDSEWFGSEGQASKLQLRRGIKSSTIYERMKQTFGEGFDQGKDILDQIYAVNSRNEAVKTKDVYKILFSDSLKNSDNFQGVSQGRKLEMLFDPKFQSVISDYIENNTINNLNGNFNRQNLVSKLKEFDTSKYKNNAENIYAHATGDINFFINNQNEAWQLKYKNEFQPWNGSGIQGALDAISIIRTLYTTMSNPGVLQGGNLQDAFLSKLGLTTDFFETDPRIQAATKEMVYEEVNDMFSSEMTYTIRGFA